MTPIAEIASYAHNASFQIASYTDDEKNKILNAIATVLKNHICDILVQNALDIQNCADSDKVFIDRLTLNEKRINDMIEGIAEIISLPNPIGEITEEWVRPNGLNLKKMRAPLGVVAIIYEARPNVTVDATALCIKSGNAVILRGGTGAINTNRILYKLMKYAIEKAGFDNNIVQFVDDTERECVKELLSYDQYIDVVIPRGGEGLKRFILQNSSIPVIASAGGNCHIYVESSADFSMAINIIINAKCSRPSVCNAVEHLLIDKQIATDFLPLCVKSLKENCVEIVGDSIACSICNDLPCVNDDDYMTEYLDKKISIKIVDDITEAVNHINTFGTKHSEAIITNDFEKAEIFKNTVDASVVYVNASTRFTDGFEFGFGAEMGISTSKLHARGPLGLKQLTSEKYVVTGNGNVR